MISPVLTEAAIRYAWRELARRAGATDRAGPAANGFEDLALPIHYGRPEGRIPGTPSLVVVPCARQDWEEVVRLPPDRLDFVDAESACPPGSRPAFPDPVPVLFWGADRRAGGRFAEVEADGSVVFSVDLVAATLFMLSRWEEIAIPARDEHGRMAFEQSVAFRQKFLDRPIVDEYGLLLREWLKVLRPGWQPTRRSFSVRLSHDVDRVHHFSGAAAGLSKTAGDMLKRRDWNAARQSYRDTVEQALAPDRVCYWRGMSRLAEISLANGMRSAFYFMAADPGPYDSGYDPASPRIRARIEELRGQGFEIGFHPSYRTADDPMLLASEKERLAGVLGESRFGGRQHFLRFHVPETWRRWEALGLAYDSTLTFAGREGFRCGTCHPYRPFDLTADRELEIEEVPLIVMDGTLREYRQLSPEDGERRILELARRCRTVEGEFTLLWHNSSLDRAWRHWAPAYERVVRALAELEGRKTGERSPGDPGLESGARVAGSPARPSETSARASLPTGGLDPRSPTEQV